MTEHICSRSTCLLQKVLRTSELYWIEVDVLTVNENIWRPPGVRHNTPKTRRYTPPRFRYQPRSFANGESAEVRDWWKKCTSPGRSQARSGKISHIKDGDPHRNGDSSFISQKWSFLFPQNRKFVNTLLVFLISLSNPIFTGFYITNI